jgi:DUF4097 and DUF4098 domain-containing protein YvlB
MNINRVIADLNTLIASAQQLLNEGMQQCNRHSGPYTEHDEIHQSFNLKPGDRVEVSRISGPVEIENSEGDVAEVHVVRSAQSKSDLVWRKLKIEQTPTGLVIEPEVEPGCPDRVGVDHHVLLKLPRQTSFTATGISGSVKIAALDGTVQVSGCSGSVIMKETNGPTDISGVSGSVILNVRHLSQTGLRVSSVSGRVELRVSDTLDADVFITSVTGRVFIGVPQQELGRSGYRIRLGQGGAPISVSGVSGDVIVRKVEGPQ